MKLHASCGTAVRVCVSADLTSIHQQMSKCQKELVQPQTNHMKSRKLQLLKTQQEKINICEKTKEILLLL